MAALCVSLLLVTIVTSVKSDCVGENGNRYPDNTGPYPTGDGCNLCHCNNGILTCTQETCGCRVRGIRARIWVTEGSTVTINDGCSVCTCSGGELSCTRRGCGCLGVDGAWVTPGSHFRRDCNRCTCINNEDALCTRRGCLGCYLESGYKELNSTWVSRNGCHECTCVREYGARKAHRECRPRDCDPYSVLIK